MTLLIILLITWFVLGIVCIAHFNADTDFRNKTFGDYFMVFLFNPFYIIDKLRD